MARCFCRWRTMLICVCTPCILLVLLVAYATVMVCAATNNRVVSFHFVASGTLNNKSFGPLPQTFWDLDQHGDAIWNRLQLTIDRHFNPVLRPNDMRTGLENDNIYESRGMQGFSEVKLDSMGENLDRLPEQIQDFAKHMHRRDYPTLIQPDGVCGAGEEEEREAPLLLLAIKSTELGFKNRQAIRQTWGQAGWVAGQGRSAKGGGGGYIRRVFLLGKGRVENVVGDLPESLQMESKHYGDILQWDFRDTFFNLTLKDVLFWSWFSRSCNRTVFVFKGDDDVFVNTPKMITYLRDQLRKPQANKIIGDFMIGDVIVAALPSQDRKSKYFIPGSFYKGRYPVYAGGGGVVYSGLLARRLHHVSKRVHLFPIDDVYVGMCMTRLNVHLVHHAAFLTFDFPSGTEEKQPCSYHTVLLVHKRSPSQLLKLWANMTMTQAQCWDAPLRKGYT
ncbi:N-acetyllactosaminide beta-1,3-N-acetylglucosaminyltransferase 2 [Gasterosteus aculeatus]|uniref:Hexosyltransferase n=2 Tax=Gasterosteus aculeatus TaxID=69293 RepID=A0AAQ4PEN0_GASAC|nr:N-acetyllactosaminide beta-1,3-N-acetylglucosaminyltransferase 2 [Gasterosteus aculeatus aculeatus]XP_040031473.1 N-acetyllactosaminide beta-1,3-N-acetylglucosaminyltransferase 2 [Gasterosteus aculeatus aculeatus]